MFGSGCSGYTSDKGEQADKFFSCPLCGTRSNLSPEGVLALPPHYLLQNRMVLATVNSCNTRLLCDICETDQTVEYRNTNRFLFSLQIVSCCRLHIGATNASQTFVWNVRMSRMVGKNDTKVMRCFSCRKLEGGGLGRYGVRSCVTYIQIMNFRCSARLVRR